MSGSFGPSNNTSHPRMTPGLEHLTNRIFNMSSSSSLITINPTDPRMNPGMENVTTRFSTMQLNSTHASDPTTHPVLQAASQDFFHLQAQNLPFPRSTVNFSDQQAVADAIKKAQCDAIISRINGGSTVVRSKTTGQINPMKKIFGNPERFHKAAEMSQFPEMEKWYDEGSEELVWSRPDSTIYGMPEYEEPYLAKKELENHYPSNVILKDMLAEVGLEQEQGHEDVDMDRENQNAAPERKLRRAGKRDFNFRQVQNRLGDLDLMEESHKTGKVVKKSKKRADFSPY